MTTIFRANGITTRADLGRGLPLHDPVKTKWIAEIRRRYRGRYNVYAEHGTPGRLAMDTIHAIYENGAFRPLSPVPIPDGTEVAADGLRSIYDILNERYNSGHCAVSA